MEDTGASAGAAVETSGGDESEANMLAQQDVRETAFENNLKFTPEWLQQLPDDLRDITEKYKDPMQLLKAHKAANDALSKRVEQFSENDWNAFRESNRNVFRVPDTPNDYNIQFGKFQEDSIDILDDNSKNVLKETFHQLGLNNDQANYIYNLINETHFRTEKERENYKLHEAKDAEAFLRNEWGKGFNENLNYAKSCLESIIPQSLNESPEDIRKWFMEKGYQNDQRLLRLISMLGRLNSNTPRTPGGNITKTDASILYNQRIRDKEYMTAFNNVNHPDHSRVTTELQELARRAMR
jgi:hypothetical protein